MTKGVENRVLFRYRLSFSSRLLSLEIGKARHVGPAAIFVALGSRMRIGFTRVIVAVVLDGRDDIAISHEECNHKGFVDRQGRESSSRPRVRFTALGCALLCRVVRRVTKGAAQG